MAGKGGGAWKVAYADFVTAMMAFFMVMWITAQSKDVKQAVAEYFRDPFVPGLKSDKATLPTNNRGASLKNRRSRGKGFADLPHQPDEPPDTPETNKLHLLSIHDGKQSGVGGMVHFPEQSNELTAEAKTQLKRLVPSLLGKRNKIEIRAHASRRPLPSGSPFHDPWQLCYARCVETMKCLEQLGVEPNRIRLSQAGVSEPYTIRDDADREANNARVEVCLLGELAEDLVGTREERARGTSEE
jgi:chemotaxis protein MotB